MAKTFKLSIAIAVIAAIVSILYPRSSEFLHTVRAHAYPYPYTAPALDIADTRDMPAATAVPILMYHGVIARGDVGPNTSRSRFIDQMEMLKKEGYETVSVDEYYRFREGAFTLPPKPIIITFDDGRKDSFYTVDEILKAFGFKSTIFVATIKPNTDDPFYLTWDELAAALESGRWEIEAHGRNSHAEIPTDAEGNTGTFLVTRAYSKESGLESVAQYQTRVEQDYADGITDLSDHLGLSPRFYAVPLNHYGKLEESNYDGAYDWNVATTKRYFKLAFVEALAKAQALESFYNYADTDPYDIKRLEVQGMTAENLRASLAHYAPREPSLELPASGDLQPFLYDTLVLYGHISTGNGITLTGNEESHAARMLFGDWGWRDYDVHVSIVKDRGKSVSVLAYYTDENNYVSLDWGEQSVRVVERKDGRERELAWRAVPDVSTADIDLRVADGVVGVRFGDTTVTAGSATSLRHGAAGLSVWDKDVVAESTIHALEITSLK